MAHIAMVGKVARPVGMFEIILSQTGKGHTRGNLPIPVLPSNKHIHINTQFYI